MAGFAAPLGNPHEQWRLSLCSKSMGILPEGKELLKRAKPNSEDPHFRNDVSMTWPVLGLDSDSAKS